MEPQVRPLLLPIGALLLAAMAAPAAAAPMVNASLVLRNDALAWGQRLDTLLPATPAARLRPPPPEDAGKRADTPASGVPVMSRPITGVVVLPATSTPVQAAASAPRPPAAQAAPPGPQEPSSGWVRTLQSWILSVARSVGS